MPGIDSAEVEVVWDEAWSTDRLSPSAAQKLRFLPDPATVTDREGYVAAQLRRPGSPALATPARPPGSPVSATPEPAPLQMPAASKGGQP